MLPGLEFLSTLSLRRATAHRLNGNSYDTYFYPRSPCGERPGAAVVAKHQYLYFYPRSPCGERLLSAVLTAPSTLFLSTLSLRRATRKPDIFFNVFVFLSTLSLRRATGCKKLYQLIKGISIHALLAESDFFPLPQARRVRHFYPRSPCGERRRDTARSGTAKNFYPRSPCGERPERFVPAA